jgi:hypothetical protein
MASYMIILKKGTDTVQFKLDATDVRRAYADAVVKKNEIFPGEEVAMQVVETGTTMGPRMANMGTSITPKG